jgi:AAA domain/Helix-turn-helix domain of resolvase
MAEFDAKAYAREAAQQQRERAHGQQQQGNGAAGQPVRPLVGVPLEDLIAMNLPQRPRLLGPWLTTSSLVMVHARTGVGKTWFSLSAFQALALGGTFLKWKADRPHKVLYLDGEMPGSQVQERGQLLLNGESTSGNLIIVTPDLQPDPMPNLATEQGRARLEPLLPGVDALAIDHLTALIRCHGEGGEGQLWIDQVQPWLLEKRRAGLAILLDHHSGKGGSQRGTSVREDILDVIIKLEQVGEERDGAHFNVVFEKTRGFYGKEAETFEARLQTDGEGKSCWSITETGETAEFMTLVAMLRDGMSVDKAARELKIGRATAYRWKAKAIEKAMII